MEKHYLKLLALVSGVIACCSFSYAGNFDCAKIAQRIVTEASANHSEEVSIDYSSDMAAIAKTCKSAVLSKNSLLKVYMKPVEGKQMIEVYVATE